MSQQLLFKAKKLNVLSYKEKQHVIAHMRPVSLKERSVILQCAKTDENIGNGPARLLQLIEFRSREYDMAWCSNAHFAAQLQASERSISRWLSKLIEHGYVISNLIYREGKVWTRVVALNYNKTKVIEKQTVHNWQDIIGGFVIGKTLNDILKQRKGINHINALNNIAGEQVGEENIYNLFNFFQEDISSNEDIYARARVVNNKRTLKVVQNANNFGRESYWNLIDRKIPIVNSETRRLNNLLKQHTRQRMLFRKTPTNYALELTIDGLFDKFRTMKNRIKAVEKAVKNGWINIGGGGRNTYKKPNRRYSTEICARNWNNILPNMQSRIDWSTIL